MRQAKLVIAMLDRLSRNLAFIATLMDSGVEFGASPNSRREPKRQDCSASSREMTRRFLPAPTRGKIDGGGPAVEGLKDFTRW